MNKIWHVENKLPQNATMEQRLQWHKEHQAHCACRTAPQSLLQTIKQKLKERSKGL